MYKYSIEYIQHFLKGLDSRQTLFYDTGIVELSLTQEMSLLKIARRVNKETTICFVKIF